MVFFLGGKYLNMGKYKLIQIKLGFVILVVFLCTHSQAKILHVSQKNLSNISSESQSRTISEAVSHLSAGDTIIIHSGIYREQVSIEQSGTVEDGLARLADLLDSEVEARLGTVTSLLEPIMILVLGALVGFIVLAMLLPIFDINQAIA